MIQILQGDAVEQLRTLPDCSVHCCVTSPPYWGLRDYGVDGQIGMEETPELFVAKIVEVFREVKRVLRDDGTLWLNFGDSYCGCGTGHKETGKAVYEGSDYDGAAKNRTKIAGMKSKDLIGIPWMVAFALRADGWYLRSDIIWSKPNPMPESVTDRCTKSHEYIFLLAKKPHYYYDGDAIREPISGAENMQYLQTRASHRELLQEQPTEGRQNWKMCGLYLPISEGLRQEIQSDGESKGNRKTVLSLRERTESEKGVSNSIPFCPFERSGMDQPHAGTLEEIQQRKTIQGKSGEILDFREGEITESKEGFEISENPIRNTSKETHREETKICACQFRKYINIGGVGSNQETIRLPMCVLSQIVETGDGSYNSVEQGRGAHKGECSSSVSNMQRKKGKPSPRKGLNDFRYNSSPQGKEYRREAGIPDPIYITRNRRTVWEIATQPTPEAHFATFPEALVEPCINAGCPIGGTVLDPFGGSGTVAKVARYLKRRAILIELNPVYISIAKERLRLNEQLVM